MFQKNSNGTKHAGLQESTGQPSSRAGSLRLLLREKVPLIKGAHSHLRTPLPKGTPGLGQPCANQPG